MNSEKMNYVIEYYQIDTQCIVGKCLLNESDIEVIRKGLGWEVLEIERCYSDLQDKERIFFRRQNIGWIDLADEFSIRPAIWIDFLSYDVHTGKELILMLNNEKPLSVFVDSYPESTEQIPEDIFEPYVRKGRLYCKECILDRKVNNHKFLMRYVMYSQPNEEWRMDAYIENIKYSDIHGISPRTERCEGELLGYSDEQNDEFLRILYGEVL